MQKSGKIIHCFKIKPKATVIHTKLYKITIRLWILAIAYIFFSCDNSSYQYTKPKPAGISISFDDRSINEWYAMRELLKKYNAKVTFFITQFDSLSQEEIQMLKVLQKEGHEVGSHGHMHVLSEYYIKEHSLNQYIEYEIVPSIKILTQHGFTPTSFAYPYGAKYRGTDKELLKYFYVLRNVSALNEEKDLTLMDDIYYSFDGDRTVSALGFDARDKLDIEMIKMGLKRAKQNGEVLFLYGHVPSVSSAKNYSFNTALLENILKESKAMNLDFYTISELYL